MGEVSERGCSVHYFQPSNDCINCEIKRTNDKIRKSSANNKNGKKVGFKTGIIMSEIQDEVRQNNIKKSSLQKESSQKYDDSNLIKCLSCEVKISQKKRYCKPCLRNLERESPQSSYPDFYGGIYRINSGSAGKYKNHYKSRKFKNHYKNVKPSKAKNRKSEIQRTNHAFGTNCSVCRRWIKWEKHSVAGAVSGGVTGPFLGAFIGVLVAGPVGATIGLLSGLPAGAYFGGKKDRPKICKSCNDERIGNCIKCSKIMTRGTHDNGGVCISCNRGSD